jgi:hypothetical protein
LVARRRELRGGGKSKIALHHGFFAVECAEDRQRLPTISCLNLEARTLLLLAEDCAGLTGLGDRPDCFKKLDDTSPNFLCGCAARWHTFSEVEFGRFAPDHLPVDSLAPIWNSKIRGANAQSHRIEDDALKSAVNDKGRQSLSAKLFTSLILRVPDAAHEAQVLFYSGNDS